MSVLSVFDIAKTTLLTTKRALDTTAHNVSNAGTPGYTRQDVVFESIPNGSISTAGTTGRGVRITEVKRLYDSFVTTQIRNEKSNLAYWDNYEQGVVRVENIFNEASDNGISPAITDFFNAWQDVSQNPEGFAQRTLLTKKAEYLANRLSGAYKSLEDERSEIFKNSQTLMSTINNLTSKIAGLNEKIAGSPGALDLKDSRDQLLVQLNQIVKVTTFEDNVGRYTVMISGTPLVDGGTVYNMNLSTDINDKMHFYVDIKDSHGVVYEQRDITNYITGGQIRSNLDLRESKLYDYMNKMNAFAVDLENMVNYYHKQGYGLDGSTGNSFFNSPLASITDPSGGGTLSSVNMESSTLDTFAITSLNKNITGWTDLNNNGVQDLPAEANWTATLTEGTYTADELAAELKKQLEASDGTGNIYTVTYDPAARKFTISNLDTTPAVQPPIHILWTNSGTTVAQSFGFTSDSVISEGASKTSDTAASSVSVSAFGYAYDQYNIQYISTNPSGESIADYVITDQTTGKLVSGKLTVDTNGFGRELIFNGIKVRIEGDITDGELFKFQISKSAAKEMSVAITDPKLVAAASDMFNITSLNNTIIFNEGNGDKTVTIPTGTYTGDNLAAAIKTTLENADTTTSNTYTVSYNPFIKKFKISSNVTAVDMKWNSSTADTVLGYSHTNSNNYDISDVAAGAGPFAVNAGVNDTIIFNEGYGNKTATIAPGAAYTGAQLAVQIKAALEAADPSVPDTYTVSFNATTQKFTIINNSGNGPMDLLWGNPLSTAAATLGFAAVNTTGIPDSFISSSSVASQASKALPGDNRNANNIAGLITQTVIIGSSPTDYYRQIVSDVGIETQSAKQSQKFQGALVDELESRREGLSGVSLDEEAANLIKYQKSFEAAAKMISMADELLSTLLAMTGK